MSNTSAQKLSAIHNAAFETSRGWNAEEIAQLLDSPHVYVTVRPDGFAMGRVVVDEAELLTIAVLPSAQGHGQGTALLLEFERTAAERGATRAFLEVATDNHAAIALYKNSGWAICGKRPNYYARDDGSSCDAILMEKHIT
ncbi:ribosomal protein S18-alanine N-acetyltransferase [Aliiroseovarius sp. F20344]|uniref:ribosomal protein S18-alanine N-acetyltransferase n=1 Tax=Aliiroseovarius sp. F20344 TaxID=2926414 RepID=UPI001FF6E809|nr:ribosomal protein S18-alanine N-acetyltransferase [Aliiroseovarius sp. F20344]MCK0143080.1 ribosomal protein S18-alanine N-acetyltransferase [Aliiroseovarius sp. F20344]